MAKETGVVPKRQMMAQVSVCQGCCCGNIQKGHPPVPVEWLKTEWKVRGLLKRVHLTITGCLGPCDVPNVIAISSSEGTQWLGLVDTTRHYVMLAEWAEQSKLSDQLLPLPKELAHLALEPYSEQPALCFEGAR